MLQLTADQLIEAIEHLYEALEILASVLKEIGSGAVRGVEVSENLAKAWFEVNSCRLYTESDVNLEELNIEAMGSINDAKCMMDSLISWEKGMTPHGKLYITQSIIFAVCNVKIVLSKLESWLYQQESGNFAIDA